MPIFDFDCIPYNYLLCKKKIKNKKKHKKNEINMKNIIGKVQPSDMDIYQIKF